MIKTQPDVNYPLHPHTKNPKAVPKNRVPFKEKRKLKTDNTVIICGYGG